MKIPKKLAKGEIYLRKSKEGKPITYYYRVTLGGKRKTFNLGTTNKAEAYTIAEQYVPVVRAKNTEELEFFVRQAKKFEKQTKAIALVNAWNLFETHPDWKHPRTMNEFLQYKSNYKEFVSLLPKTVKNVHEVTFQHVTSYADLLRTRGIAVATHNRRMMRLRKVFAILSKESGCENPFIGHNLFRSASEEYQIETHRLNFTKEQVQQLLNLVKDKKTYLKDREEIYVLFLIGMFTGQRLKDCILLQWTGINLAQRLIILTQYKTGRKVTIPIAAQLYDELVRLHDKKKDSMYVLPNLADRYRRKNKLGKSIGGNTIDAILCRLIAKVVPECSRSVEGRKRKLPQYGFHSFRHAFVSYCAEAGIPQSVVQSIVGANVEILNAHYTHVGIEQQAKALERVFNFTCLEQGEGTQTTVSI